MEQIIGNVSLSCLTTDGSMAERATSHLLSLTEPCSAGLGSSATPSKEPQKTLTRCPPRVSWNTSSNCRILPVFRLPDFVLLQSTVLIFQQFFFLLVVLLASLTSCNGCEMAVQELANIKVLEHKHTGKSATVKQGREQYASLGWPPAQNRGQKENCAPPHGGPLAIGGTEGAESSDLKHNKKQGLAARDPVVYKTLLQAQFRAYNFLDLFIFSQYFARVTLLTLDKGLSTDLFGGGVVMCISDSAASSLYGCVLI